MPRIGCGLTALAAMAILAIVVVIASILADSLPQRIGLLALAGGAIVIGVMVYLGRQGSAPIVNALLLITVIALLLIAAVALAIGSYAPLHNTSSSTVPALNVAPSTIRTWVSSVLIAPTLLDAVSVVFPGVARIVLGGPRRVG